MLFLFFEQRLRFGLRIQRRHIWIQRRHIWIQRRSFKLRWQHLLRKQFRLLWLLYPIVRQRFQFQFQFWLWLWLRFRLKFGHGFFGRVGHQPCRV
ncbi:MAG: hypothetical protein WAK33_20455 [Silvibacterium sp.]